ncbi:hypothetical protein AMATHDRAFT_4314 [Amanita thiersii Skay4041]|uniref:Uncharacterized protein n=1 Tax=Amanita thiersii Skay4041 TaxID=703135 RepID=A0A2A9NP78_9AGAR|nr:hypothetical protein AMATHDRAFT_4314 [Amanita thiersii Skay4041]
MTRFTFRSQSPLSANTTVAKRWALSAGIWGIGAGTAALFILSVTPLVKREFLSKLPVMGSYYADNTPASDKPF